MEGSGAGWLSLAASWEISLGTGSCTGEQDILCRNAMTFAEQAIKMKICFFQLWRLPAVLQGALQGRERRDLDRQLHSDGSHIRQW